MPYTDAGARIYYEDFGTPGDPLVVLVSGGGAQMLSWDDRFIDLLTAHGLRVARFDNRDTGLSERFGGESDLDGGYDLVDMGDDILRVMDALGEESAHLSASVDQQGVQYNIDQFYPSEGDQTYVVTFSFSPDVTAADRAAVYESVLATWTWA